MLASTKKSKLVGVAPDEAALHECAISPAAVPAAAASDKAPAIQN